MHWEKNMQINHKRLEYPEPFDLWPSWTLQKHNVQTACVAGSERQKSLHKKYEHQECAKHSMKTDFSNFCGHMTWEWHWMELKGGAISGLLVDSAQQFDWNTNKVGDGQRYRLVLLTVNWLEHFEWKMEWKWMTPSASSGTRRSQYYSKCPWYWCKPMLHPVHPSTPETETGYPSKGIKDGKIMIWNVYFSCKELIGIPYNAVSIKFFKNQQNAHLQNNYICSGVLFT